MVRAPWQRDERITVESGAEMSCAALETPVDLISLVIEQADGEAGRAFLGDVGNYIAKIQPHSALRFRGCRKLSDMLSNQFNNSLHVIEYLHY